jgi:hypothetical protein
VVILDGPSRDDGTWRGCPALTSDTRRWQPDARRGTASIVSVVSLAFVVEFLPRKVGDDLPGGTEGGVGAQLEMLEAVGNDGAEARHCGGNLTRMN